MGFLNGLIQRVKNGGAVTREEALGLWDEPLEALCQAADELRRFCCGSGFDLCTIVNGKSGRCSENCRFCAQSAHYRCPGVEEYGLLDDEEILQAAKGDFQRGVMRFSIVTSGRRLSDDEVTRMCRVIARLRAETGLSICASFGLLNQDQFTRLKAAGLSRVHNNLETSRRFFPSVCTTHQFEDKVAAIRAAQAAGLSVCSGGIVGLGESVEDRIDMALTLRNLGVKSVPVNLLNPIPGTPLAAQRPLSADELRRVVAVYRFLLPDAFIRLAGGRGLLADKGEGCFRSGANAVISGDMLTTAGYSVQTDWAMVRDLGFHRGAVHD